LTIIGKGRIKVSFITAYRVSQTTMNEHVGPMSAYSQQCHLLHDEYKYPDPRGRIIDDLIAFINSKKDKGHDIVLMIDANETLKERNSGIRHLLDATGLVDVLAQINDSEIPSTYINAKKRCIDFMLMTPRAAAAVEKMGMLSFNDGILTDHRGIFVDFDVDNSWVG